MGFLIIVVVLIFVGFVIYVESGAAEADAPISNPTNSSAGVAFTPSSQEEYELIQFDEAMFTGGTTSQRFQKRIGWYIRNGYRIHTMNVVVKQGWFAGQKQTYTVLFEKLPQPMSEGAAMLNS